MKSIQLIKQVNNTELGKAGTHETYILIPQDAEISDLFEEINKEYKFKDSDSLKDYTIRLTYGREKRIVGMGPYYRDHNVMAGDKILLEKRIFSGGETHYLISMLHDPNVIFFQKVKGFFEVLNSENISQLINGNFFDKKGSAVKVEYYGEIQKRKDSTIKTAVYSISTGNDNIQALYQERDIIELKISNGIIGINKVHPLKKYTIEVSE